MIGSKHGTLRVLPLHVQAIIRGLLIFVTEHPELRLDPGQESGKEKKNITSSNQEPFFVRRIVIKTLQNSAVNTVCLFIGMVNTSPYNHACINTNTQTDKHAIFPLNICLYSREITS